MSHAPLWSVQLFQYEVAWTLTNICSAEHEDCQDVVDQGGIRQFVRLLAHCDDLEVLEQVGGCWEDKTLGQVRLSSSSKLLGRSVIKFVSLFV